MAAQSMTSTTCKNSGQSSTYHGQNTTSAARSPINTTAAQVTSHDITVITADFLFPILPSFPKKKNLD